MTDEEILEEYCQGIAPGQYSKETKKAIRESAFFAFYLLGRRWNEFKAEIRKFLKWIP